MFGVDNFYLEMQPNDEEDQTYVNEKIIDYINQERAKLLKDASEYAKGILNDNRELLDKLVNALLEKGILDENDLNEIFSK